MKMRYLCHLINTKGLSGLCSRTRQIVKHFGVTSKKIEHCLETFISITDEFGCTPTLCITAVLLDRYPHILQMLNHSKTEIAIHGYVHIDYTALSKERITEHLMKAQEIFKKHGNSLYGFRFPYLSWNENILEAVKTSDFLWTSNQVICWDVVDKNIILKEKWSNFQRVLERLYVKTRDAAHYLSLPKLENGLVEIPISVPDDEIIIDRLGINNVNNISKIWLTILKESFRRGELFTLQSHHERVHVYKDALRSVFTHIKESDLKVWIASLSEIAAWWREKDSFNFQIISRKNGPYDMKANCSDRATILVKNPHKGKPSTPLFDNYTIIKDRNFSIKCEKKPFIGLAHHSPVELINFLRQEGFMTETSSNKDDYAFYLEKYRSFKPSDEKELIDSIEGCPHPLIRFWRWPDRALSALSITGDIDGITLLDFFRRSFHF